MGTKRKKGPEIVRGELAKKLEMFADDQNYLLSPPEAALYLSVTENTLKTWRFYGTGPTFVRRSPKRVCYQKSDLDAFIESRKAQNTISF